MAEQRPIPDGALASLRALGADWLTPGAPTVVGAAPGRLDVMGGIADYSGAVVLEGTIGDLAMIAAQRRADDLLRVRTAGPEAARLPCREFTLRIGDFYTHDAAGGATLRPYHEVRALFEPPVRWAAYVLGVIYVLLAEGELDQLRGGADLLIYSTVPLGAGVASSAALEVAAMRVAGALWGACTSGLRLAALCQMAENRVVGAPCGIMDQVTCALGQQGRLLALRCQPHEVLGWYAPPAGFTFGGLDSGVKHAVGGARYPIVRCAAFMGRRIIREALRRNGEDPERAAYLCNLSPAEYRARFRDLLPAQMCGADFLRAYGETGDAATTVDPNLTYPVRGATEHPIYENARVSRFIRLLEQAARSGGDGAARLMRNAGRLMYGSHRSYSRNCGLGSRETDLLVSLARAEGPAGGLYGAKITGGGSGGTVAFLATAAPDGSLSPEARAAIERVRQGYAARVGWLPRLIAGSRPGAEYLQPLQITW